MADATNIWIAAGDGELDLVKAFVAGGTPVDAQDENGYTPLCVNTRRTRPRRRHTHSP
jgi:hypothetical protein